MPGSECGAAGLTTKRLDPLGMAMLAIADEGMDVSIGDCEVRTLLIGTGEAFGGYPLRRSPPAFHLTPGAYWRRGRSHSRGTEATDGAIKGGAGLEKTVQRGVSPACF